MAKERVERARECLSYPRANAVLLGESRAFRFDDAFGPGATQGEVYERLVSPLVESCFRGYNATVLAYGQTGSGKTYTMGSGCVDVPDDETGIIPRVVNDVFAEAHRRAECGASETSVRCAFLEVHNEEVRDLLHPDTSPKRITIRERADGAIVAAGAREVATRSAEETLRLLELGCVARTTGGTKMNAQSSRSHAIFTIIIEQTHLTHEARRRHKGRYASAKFHLVDLAGSERKKRREPRGRGSRRASTSTAGSGARERHRRAERGRHEPGRGREVPNERSQNARAVPRLQTDASPCRTRSEATRGRAWWRASRPWTRTSRRR